MVCGEWVLTVSASVMVPAMLSVVVWTANSPDTAPTTAVAARRCLRSMAMGRIGYGQKIEFAYGQVFVSGRIPYVYID